MLASFGTSNDSEQPIPSVHTVWYSVLASGDIRASTSFLVGHQTATFFFLVPFKKRSRLNQCQVPPWPVIPYVNALSPQYRGTMWRHVLYCTSFYYELLYELITLEKQTYHYFFTTPWSLALSHSIPPPPSRSQPGPFFSLLVLVCRTDYRRSTRTAVLAPTRYRRQGESARLACSECPSVALEPWFTWVGELLTT